MIIKRRKLAIFSILFGCAAVLLLLAGLVIYKSVLAPFFGLREPPPELREAKTIIGADFLTKSEFYQATKRNSWRDLLDPNKLKSRFDSIEDVAVGQLDGQPGLDIGLVGRLGITLLDSKGKVTEHINYQFEKGTIKVGPFKTEREKDSFGTMRAIDVESDGVCEILGYGGMDGAVLFDHRGHILFNRGESADGKSSIHDVAAGDIDGDGQLEFVASWGYEPWNGIELFDRYGNIKWRHEEEFKPGQLEIVDVNGDGKAEFVEEDGREIKIRDAKGTVISKVETPVYLWHLSLCSRPEGQGPPQDLAVREGSLWLIDLDGKNFSRFDAPLSEITLEKPRVVPMPGFEPLTFDKEEIYRARGLWIRLKRDQPKYLAVIATFGSLDRSLFYVYDQQGKLIYQEILPDNCNAIVALPPDNDSDTENILVGGEKTIWRYGAR